MCGERPRRRWSAFADRGKADRPLPRRSPRQHPLLSNGLSRLFSKDRESGLKTAATRSGSPHASRCGQGICPVSGIGPAPGWFIQRCIHQDRDGPAATASHGSDAPDRAGRLAPLDQAVLRRCGQSRTPDDHIAGRHGGGHEWGTGPSRRFPAPGISAREPVRTYETRHAGASPVIPGDLPRSVRSPGNP